MPILEIFFKLCNISAPISCTPSTICLATILPHLHQSLKVPSTSSANFQAALTIPSYIFLDLTALQPINSFNRYLQETSTLIIYQMTISLLRVVEKAAPTATNTQFPVSYSVFLEFPSIGQPKINQPLSPIQQHLRSTPSIWTTKWPNVSDPP